MSADSIIQAAVEHCWQEEQLAHAEWLYARTAAQRADLATDKRNPWRAIMRTTARALLEQLEADGFYDNGRLQSAQARSRKPKIYEHSPYDYEVARRVEAQMAERKWGDDAP